MKKFLIFFLVCIFFLAFSSCKKTLPTTFVTTPSEVNPVLLLQEYDYNVYVDGEVEIFINEEESAFILFDAIFHDGQICHTRRDIRIGSTIDEVAVAYAGIPITQFEFGATNDIPLDELIKTHPEIHNIDEFYIAFETGFVGDNVYTGLEFTKMLEDNGIHFMDYLDDSEKYNKKYKLALYYLDIIFEDSIVTSITIFK